MSFCGYCDGKRHPWCQNSDMNLTKNIGVFIVQEHFNFTTLNKPKQQDYALLLRPKIRTECLGFITPHASCVSAHQLF